MPGFSNTPKIILRLIHLPPRIAYAVGLGPIIGNMILLLTTIGRKSGKPRVTPLQYEEVDGQIQLAAALGQKADWLQNILANPRVEIRLKSRAFAGSAEVITSRKQTADFLEVRLRRHPRIIGAMLRAEGISLPPARCDLERYAGQITLVAITPERNPADRGA